MSGQIPATNCLPVGALVGAYQITGMLRQGPLATVYSARGPGQASEVAIEVLNDSSPDPARLSRCQREALAAGEVGHPAILAPSAQGLLPDGRAYGVLELLEGESLQARLDRRGALPLGEAGPWLDAVMEALGAAHAAGLVHRSLTPTTLFLQTSPQGQVHVRVLDFGVSQLIGGDSQLGPQISRDGQVLGSPRYLAPEQASASYGGVGPWTDVYSLGAIAFHVLAGRPPYLAPTAGEILIAHLQAKVPSLREHRQGLPAALDAVLRQALAKRPEERFSTMEAFRRAFRGSLRGSVVLPIAPDLDGDQAGPGLGARPAQPSPQRPVSGQDLGLERTLPPGEALAMGDTMTPFAPPSAASPVPGAPSGTAATLDPSERMAWAQTLRPEVFAKARSELNATAPLAPNPWRRDRDSLEQQPLELEARAQADLGPQPAKAAEPELRPPQGQAPQAHLQAPSMPLPSLPSPPAARGPLSWVLLVLGGLVAMGGLGALIWFLASRGD